MSLEQLRVLRRGGRRPSVAVRVVIGKPPRWFDDGPLDVVIDRPLTDLDLRPLLGLPVEVFDIQDNADFTMSVVARLEELKTTLIGAVGRFGQVGVSPEYVAVLTRHWERLCR
jgi:hypothetical protein